MFCLSKIKALARPAGLGMALWCSVTSVAQATWSIVVVNRKTGEVGIASATCLTNFDLRLWLPVMRVGLGGGVAQASIDDGAMARQIMWDEIQNGTEAKDIVDIMKAQVTNPSIRQWGLALVDGTRASHTGGATLEWSSGESGREGDLIYAVQGNILTGEPVVLAALDALLNTDSDIPGRMMAAMEAARAMGGDGRCSCDLGPEDCGAPPASFEKSAHVGFMLVSRRGDVDGICNATEGCATGDYYLNLNVIGGVADPDPVETLQMQFDQWRGEWVGRPDHVLSTMEWEGDNNDVPGNGTATAVLKIALMDWTATSLSSGGAAVRAVHTDDSDGLSFIDQTIDHGDGTYSIPIVAGLGQGIDKFEIYVNDGLGEIRLATTRRLNLNPTLAADTTDLSATGSGTVNFDLQGPDSAFGREYLVLAALNSDPGIAINGMTIPLNPDELFLHSYIFRNGPHFVNTDGILGADGAGSAQMVFNPPGLTPFVGSTIDVALITVNPLDFTSNGVTLTIVP